MRWTDSARASILIAVLAGPVQAQPAPLSLLDVPFISQSEALCGGAAAAMVLRYWGARGLDAEAFSHLVDRSAAGIRTDALVTELRTRGWTAIVAEGAADGIARELQRGRPVIALIEDRPSVYHYVVVVGVTTDAVVFHDPARNPLRVVGWQEFDRRWRAARRWMAVVLPGDARAAPDVTPASASAPEPVGECERLIAAGIERAQANDLDVAEQRLTAALSCGGAAAMRELAGVRLLQKRWADVEALSEAATGIDPRDVYGWRLLGTSRFVQNDRAGALDAWNRVGEPRLDLLRVAGAARTRQRVVETLVDARPGELVSADLLLRSERRLRALPAAASASVELVPVPGGLAELRATVNERPAIPTGVWSYAAAGAVAAARKAVGVTLGPVLGAGERTTIEWRFWPGRPRVGVAFHAPAPFGGVWSASVMTERERFTAVVPDQQRSAGSLQWSDWLTARARLAVELGLETWEAHGTTGRSRADVQYLSASGRFDARGGVEVWRGASAFSRARVDVAAATSTRRRGRVFLVRAGGGWGSARLPPLLWFGGDTGATRPTLLRAHPLVDDGRLRIEQLGRHVIHITGEAQQWWALGPAGAGAAVFVDAMRTSERAAPSSRGDVDVGAGIRVALPGLPGVLRADVATPLRGGGARWSFVYEP